MSDLPQAIISHRMPGRIRLRIPAMRRQDSYFATLRERMTALPGLRQLTTNTRTGSVLIEHAGELGDLGEFGVKQELFTLELSNPPTLSQTLYHLSGQPDAVLKELSGGQIDVAGLTVLALTGLGISQFVRGNALPAGWTLLWNAANLVRDAGKK